VTEPEEKVNAPRKIRALNPWLDREKSKSPQPVQEKPEREVSPEVIPITPEYHIVDANPPQVWPHNNIYVLKIIRKLSSTTIVKKTRNKPKNLAMILILNMTLKKR